MYRFSRDAALTITLGDNSTIEATGWGILDYIENVHRIRRIALVVPKLHSPPLLAFLGTFNTLTAPFMPRIIERFSPTLSTPALTSSLPNFIL